jgi:hypothetical protein
MHYKPFYFEIQDMATSENYAEPIFAQARSAAGSKKLCEAGFRRLPHAPCQPV